MKEPVRIRLGIIGLGLIAQAVHIPNLARLSHLFEITAVCDLSTALADAVSRSLPGRPDTSTDWHDVVRSPDVDAVLILTPGAHAAIALAALQAGMHVLSEKPLAVSMIELDELSAAAHAGGLVLQVGYMKMLDPAIEQARDAIGEIGDIRLVRVTVRHPTEDRQTSSLPIRRFADVDPGTLQAARQDEAVRIGLAIGDVPAGLESLYRDILLGSVIHELSVLRALGLDLPDRFGRVEVWPFDAAVATTEPPSILAHADSGSSARLDLAWLWVPDYPGYEERIEVIGTAGSISLEMPEPYGSNIGATLEMRRTREMDKTISTTRSERDSGFLRELIGFHDSVITGAPVIADAAGAIRDIACLQLLLRAIADGAGVSLGGEAGRSAG